MSESEELEAMAETTRSPKVSSIGRFAMGVQVFLLRRNMMGSMSDFVMVITVTGRKSGKQYSTPIAYLRDGESIIALNAGGYSQWFKNVRANPEVTLEIKGQKMNARGEEITDPAEVERVFELYKSKPDVFERLFKVSVDAPESEQIAARDKRKYMRFTVI